MERLKQGIKKMLVRFDDNTEYDYEINDGKWINIPKLGQHIKVLWDIELKSKGKSPESN